MKDAERNDPFHFNLLDPFAPPEVAAAVERRLAAVLGDSTTPNEARLCANYYMAQVHEYRGNWVAMAESLDNCGLPFGRDQDDYDYFSHKGWAEDFGVKQEKAIMRGVPPIHVNSLPQSGSSFLTAFITRAFDLDRCRITKGPYMSAQIVPEWLTHFARGGATTHQHLLGTPANIAALEAKGLTKTLIHVRHPVAALISGFRLHQSSADDDVRFFFKRLKLDVDPQTLRDERHGLTSFAKIMLPFIIEFMTSWMDYICKPAHIVEVMISRYEDVVADPVAFGERIFGFFTSGAVDLDCAVTMVTLQREARDRGAHNFHGGVSGELMRTLDVSTRRVFEALIPPQVLNFYSYDLNW